MITDFSFDVLKDLEIIEIHLHDTDTFIDLPISKFWNWVVKNELHHYCVDYYDESKADRHGQDVGVLNEERYFMLNYNDLKKDLQKYLDEKKI